MLILKEYKAIIDSETLFEFFYFYVIDSLLSHSLNFGFVVQIPQLLSLKNKLFKFYNIHYLVHIIKFFFNFSLFMFKNFSQSNSSKLLILFTSFSAAFLTKPCKCKLSLSIFLLSFFNGAVSYFCYLILLSS